MRQELLDLHEIQKIDLSIREFEQAKERLTSRLSVLEDSVKEFRLKTEQLVTQRDDMLREIKTNEGIVQTEAVKIKKWEQRLSDIRNQREYLALSREVEGSKRSNRELEEKILETMAAKERVEKELDTVQDQLAEHEVDFSEERETIEHDIHEAETKISSDADRRNRLLPNIPKALLKKYETVRQKRLGVGLVAVVQGCCQGCNMNLPPQLYNILQRGDSIEQCPSCQRIIFWDQHLIQEESSKITDPAHATP